MLPTDLGDAIDAVVHRTNDPRLRQRWAYYAGDHPKIYATPKLRETFKALADSLTENYCGLAVNARLSRLEVEGWDGLNAERAEQVWMQGGFPQRQDVFYRWALVHGAAYLVVQDDTLVVNSAAICYAEPDPDDWMGVAWAGKAFIHDSRWHVTLWDEDSIYRLVGPEANPTQVGHLSLPGNQSFYADAARPEESHGYGRVPVFPVNPYGYMAPPLLDQISSVQDRINKLSANKFVAAEFGAFKQRVFFTRQEVTPYDVRQQPDHAIVLDPGDADGRASVMELGGSDLSNYDNAKNAEVDALFTIATLPRHLRVNPGAVPSGEAIKADESPFVESLKDHQREFGEALVSAMNLLGVEADPIWRDVEPHDGLSNAQIVQALSGAGVPWQAVATEYLGMTPEDIADADRMIQSARDAISEQTSAFLSNPTLTE